MLSTQTIMTMLAVMAAITSIVTEGVKMLLDDLKVAYVSNVVVLIVAMIIGCGGTALYYVNQQIPMNALTAVYLAIMGVANWLAAMLGYDKVKQALTQMGKTGE